MPDYTCVNDSLMNKSHINHYFVSDNVYYTIDGIHIYPNGINLPKHVAIGMTISVALTNLRPNSSQSTYVCSKGCL